MNNQLKKRTVVCISGSGSNLQALIDTANESDYPATIVGVISNVEDAYGLQRAANAGIPTRIIPHEDYDTRDAFDAALDAAFADFNADIICLAGFMRLLTQKLIEKWQNRILNIHPSLLPAFPGLHVHEKVLTSGARFSGCTVHIVRPEMDAGPIVIQAAVPVAEDDTAETLATRVLQSEHIIYPRALDWLASGKARVEGDHVVVEGIAKTPDALIWPNR